MIHLPNLRRPTSPYRLAVALAAVLLAAGCGPFTFSGEETPAPSPDAGAPEGGEAPELGSAEDADLALARALLARESALLFGGEGGPEVDSVLLADIQADISDLDFADDPEGLELARTLFGENPLLSERNPLVTDREREQWLAAAIKNVGQDKALAHLREEARRLAAGEVDRAGWYEHVAACEKVCNKIVSGLLHSHVQRVRELPHRLVVFDHNRGEADTAAARDVEGFLDEVARTGGSHELLLIGRASRSGDKEYNRWLSEKRVEGVKALAQRRGWPGERIHGFGLGYEPPQITEEIARLYGLDDTLSNERRNRSVLLVAHPMEEG